MKHNIIKIVASIVFTFCSLVLFSSCQSNNVSSNEIPEILRSEIKWLYISQPLKFEKDRLNSCNILVFYINNDLGRIDCDTRIWDGKKTIYIKDYELIAVGKWNLENDKELKVNFEKCKCSHCRELGPTSDATTEELENPLPFSKLWEILKNEIGDIESEIITDNYKYKLIKEDGYHISKIEDLLDLRFELNLSESEVFRCYKQDLEYF